MSRKATMVKKTTSNVNTMDTLTKKQINQYLKFKSAEAVIDLIEGMGSTGEWVSLEDLAKSNDFLSSKSISAYLNKGKTVNSLTGKKAKRSTRRKEKRYVNVEDENDVIIRVEDRKVGYELC